MSQIIKYSLSTLSNRDAVTTRRNPYTSPRHVTDLRIFERQLLGELLAVGLADVLLLLEHSFETAPLTVGEDGSSEHAASRLSAKSAEVRQVGDVLLMLAEAVQSRV